jgi:hypothetical protein
LFVGQPAHTFSAKSSVPGSGTRENLQANSRRTDLRYWHTAQQLEGTFCQPTAKACFGLPLPMDASEWRYLGDALRLRPLCLR